MALFAFLFYHLLLLCLAVPLVQAQVPTTPVASKPSLELSLSQAIEIALQNNRDLQTARRNLSQAASNYRASKAGYSPQIQGGIVSGHLLNNTVDQTALPWVVNTFTFGANLTISMPLDLSGATGRAVQQALIGLVTSKANYILASQTLVVTVYAQYLTVLRALEAINIDKVQVEATAEQLRVAQARLKVGRVPELDVLNARVQLANAQQTLKIDEGLYEVALSQLRNTLVLDQNQGLKLTDRLDFKPEPFSYEQTLQEALKNRLEIQIARLRLEAARIAYKSTNDPYLPTLSITGSYGYNVIGRGPREAFSAETRPSSPSWNAGANLVVPLFIFDGGIIRENKFRAITTIEQAEADIWQTKESIALEVKNSLINLTNSKERVDIGKGSLDVAQETLRIAEMRYRLGISSFLEVTDARSSLRTSQLNFLNALIEYNIGKINLYRVIGKALANEPGAFIGSSDNNKK